MKSTYNFITSNNDLKNVHIAISGVGKVGSKLAKILANVGAIVEVTGDIGVCGGCRGGIER